MVLAFIKRFQTQLLHTLFDCKDSSEILTKGYENALFLVTQAIDTIMTGEGLDDKDLIISNLLRQDIQKYRSLFPCVRICCFHVSAAIQSRRYPLKGETIQYIYTNSKYNNPLCRVTPVENVASLPPYDKEKYKEMVLDGAETVLGFIGFNRTAYSNGKNGRSKKWYELNEQRTRDMQAEMI